MSGHSKWSTIKRKKAANDSRRGKLFTKLARDITIAAREGGGDEEMNVTLRLAIDKAKNANMPKDNIERAVKRGTGELKDQADFEAQMYEAYGPSGVALIIEVMTDNRNRTIAELKHAISRTGGSMAEPGSVAWQFEQKGYITIPSEAHDFDEVFMVAAEAGAEDVESGDDFLEVFTPREDLHGVLDALNDAGFNIDEARLDWIPKVSLDLDVTEATKVMTLIEDLEDLDDTQQVYSNLNVTDELMAQFEAAG